ncbi:transposase [Pseudomonas putida]|nr:hypothetical protein [Pseudomonas putida]AHZ77924.1 transposase [Pseudomonas putida]
MISEYLKAQQLKVGRYLAGKLMEGANLESKQRRPHRNRSKGVEAFVAKNLLERNFEPTAINQVWCGDVTRTVYPRRGRYSHQKFSPNVSHRYGAYLEQGAIPVGAGLPAKRAVQQTTKPQGMTAPKILAKRLFWMPP